MKTINRIQYFLFAIILLGMFASFAQNDYSFYLLSYPHLFIALLFFIEAIVLFRNSTDRKSSPTYSILECFALGLFFTGAFLISIHWPGVSIIIVTASFILLLIYSGFGIKELNKYFKNKNRITLIFFCLAFGSCLSMVGYIFHFHHWAFARLLALLATVLFLLFLLLTIFNVKFRQDTDTISFRDCMRLIKTRLLFSYVFFSFWMAYVTLVSFGIAPRLYSLANPPALEKMYQEQNPAAEIYQKHYQQFLENRKASNNNLHESMNSNN